MTGPADLDAVLVGFSSSSTDPAAIPEFVLPDPAQPSSLSGSGSGSASGEAAADLPRKAWVEQIMGMPISVHLRGPDPVGAGSEAVQAVFAQLREVDRVFSTWKADSEVSRLQRGELDVTQCAPEVREVVQLCAEAKERTEGWFDAWLPGPNGGPRRFDPTGLVKGWAIERAGDLLAAVPEHDFLINAGGDITVGCHRTDTPPWTIGIENPADRSRLVATAPLRTGGVATSGTAARGAHILDPTTGLPATALGSVTVIGPSLMWADVYATAAFARGPACADWLRGLAEHVSLLVALDGTLTTITPS